MAVPASQPMTNLRSHQRGAIAGIADCIRISGHRDDPCPEIRTSMLRIEAGSGPFVGRPVPSVQPGAMPLSVSSWTAFPFFARWASPMPRST